MLRDKYGNVQNPLLHLKFKCPECKTDVDICWTCNGYGYYHVDPKPDTITCTTCSGTGLRKVKQPNSEAVS